MADKKEIEPVYVSVYQDGYEGYDRMHVDEFQTLEDAIQCQEQNGGIVCKKIKLVESNE